MLGGFGKSDSVDMNRFPIKQYANNDGWFDDTSDGPVIASVTLKNDKSIPMKDSAWVIVAPPKFAPFHYPIVTLYETMKDFALDQNWITKPKEVSFMRDIYPIFFRVIQYKWLNSYAETGHGTGGPGSILAKLLPSQYENLKRWSEGDFISDWNENLQINSFQQKKIEELPLQEQPSALDKAALELSIGAPFFPGIEITYIVWDPSTYDNKPFRINSDLKPGDITKHMALPWQADFLACADEWWPVARPDNVIPEDSNSFDDLSERKEWARRSNGTIFNQYIDMVSGWSTLGFIKPKKINDETSFIEMERSQ